MKVVSQFLGGMLVLSLTYTLYCTSEPSVAPSVALVL